MTADEFDRIMTRLVDLWPAQVITDGQYTEAARGLGPYPYGPIDGAIDTLLRQGCRWRPTVADLIRESGLADPATDGLAAEVPGMIADAARRYGSYAMEAARDALPSAAWAVVTQLGGWRQVCSMPAASLAFASSKLAVGAVSLSRQSEGALNGPGARHVLGVD